MGKCTNSIITVNKKNDKGLTINDSEGKKDEEINFDDEVLDKILDDSVPYYESTIRKPRIGNLSEYERIRNLSEFDEYIKKIKNENNKNIINALVGKTNANMTIRDRTCGFEFHYILTTIMICLENINKDHMKQPEYIALYD